MISALLSRFRASPWPFILIFALAAIPRLAALQLIDYRYDEAVAVHFAFDIADGRWLILAPHSGSIATHPALSLYLMALPALFARDVFWVAGFRAALDVVAIGLVAKAVSLTSGRLSAFVAALAYAIGPWAIYFARRTVVSPIGLFPAIALLGAVLLVRQGRRSGWFIAVLGVALAIGSHLTGVYMLPGLAFALVLGWRRLTWKTFVIGLLPLAVVGIAYVTADAATGFVNIRALMQPQGGGFGTAPFDFALWQTSSSKLAEVLGLPALFVREKTLPDTLGDLPQALLLFGMLLVVVRWWRRRGDTVAQAGLLALGFWVGIIVPQLKALPVPQPHYVQMAMPAAFALIGSAAAWIWSQASRTDRVWPRIGLTALAACMAVYQLAYWAGINAAAAGPGPFPGYRPAQVAMADVEAARKLADLDCSGAGGIVVLGPKADPDVDEPAAIYRTLLAEMRPRLINSREAVLAPGMCQYWLVLPGDAPAMAVFGNGQLGVMRPPRLAGADRPKLGEWSTGIALVDAGLHLGDSAWVTATLRVTAGEGGETRWFARLVRDGTQIASKDISGPARSIWRTGDTIGLLFDFGALSVPSGAALDLRIGSYRYPQLSGIGVKLPDETWVDAVTLRMVAP